MRDAEGNPTKTTRPNGSVVTRSFDAKGNVLTETEAFNGAETTYTYDALSQPTSVTDPRGHTTTMVRDAQGNVTERRNPLGHVTSFDYDARGLLVRREDPNGLVTTYGYNAKGLLDTLTETPPPGSPGGVRITTFSYGAAGRLTETTPPDGVLLRYTYDPRGRVIAIENQLDERIALTYDEVGNVLRTDTHDPDATLVRTLEQIYDQRDRLIEARTPHLPGEDSVTKRTLDANDNLTALLDPNGHLTRNGYDPVDRPFRSTDPENGRTEYTYDTNDRLTEVRAPNGVLTRYTYDVLGRVTSETKPRSGQHHL